MLYLVGKLILYPLFKIFFKLKVEGSENVPLSGGCILSSNHCSMLDPIVLGLATKRKIYFLTKQELFKIPIFSYIIKKLGAIPLNREKLNISSYKNCCKILANNEILGIFPEGTRSEDGRLKDIKLGVIKLSIRNKVPIIPVGISGTYNVLPKGKMWIKLHPISVKFGKPLYFSEKENFENLKKILFAEMKKLLWKNKEYFEKVEELVEILKKENLSEISMEDKG